MSFIAPETESVLIGIGGLCLIAFFIWIYIAERRYRATWEQWQNAAGEVVVSVLAWAFKVALCGILLYLIVRFIHWAWVTPIPLGS